MASLKEARKHPLVLVCWEDITSAYEGAWFDLEADLRPATVYTVGWLIRETDKHLILAGTIGEHSGDVEYSGDTLIPKGCAIDVQVLRKVWQKKPRGQKPAQVQQAESGTGQEAEKT